MHMSSSEECTCPIRVSKGFIGVSQALLFKEKKVNHEIGSDRWQTKTILAIAKTVRNSIFSLQIFENL